MSNLTHEQLVEKVARRLCAECAADPDELMQPFHPKWREYASLSRAAISVIAEETKEPTEAMEQARDKAAIEALQADVFDGAATYRAMHRASPLYPEGK